MTPNEKAKDLVRQYDKCLFDQVLDYGVRILLAKQCAIICVDELIQAIYNIEGDDLPVHNGKNWVNAVKYYKEVKKEIETL